MRKKICALVLVLAIVLGLYGCGTNQISLKYADEWDETIPVLQTEYDVINKMNDNRLNEILDECKEMVKGSLDQEKFSFWNWERLNNVQIYWADGLVSTYNQQIVAGGNALYNYDDHEILVFPVCEGYEQGYFKTIIIHELIHVLTYSEKCYTHMMWEGMADYFARKVSEQNELPFELAYVYEVHFVELFVTFMGEKEFAEGFFDGSLNQLIDQNTKEGSGEKFEAIIFYMANYSAVYGRRPTSGDMQIMLKAGQDIVCHMCASYISEKDAEQQEKIRENMLEKVLLDKEYFQLILDG